MRLRRCSAIVAWLLAWTFAPGAAWALDKQGSAHGGQVGEEEEGGKFGVSGSAMLGVSVLNQTYAARADNTGLALMRYAGHADVDLFGRALSIPLDVNFFTDRERRGLAVFAPSELDLIGGVTSTHSVARGFDLEAGARVERDMNLDRGRFSQSYADVRVRGLYSLGRVWPKLARDLVSGDISGHVTLGWFAFNPTYAARPDNSGNALFRYAWNVQLSVVRDRLAIGFDATMFTDRRANVVRPSELDATYDVMVRLDAEDAIHLAYERDMPLDRGRYVQDFVYVLFVRDFEIR